MEKTLIKVNQAALRFLSTLSLEETYKIICKEAIKLVKGLYGSIWIWQDGKFDRVYASINSAYKTRVRKRANTYKAFQTKKIIIADIDEMKEAHPELDKYGIRQSIFIPLIYQKKSIGVLVINLKKRIKLSKKFINILLLYGTMAGLAIKQAMSYTTAKESLHTRDMFISMATHELRTPLTSMYGYIQLLKQKLNSARTPEARWVNELFTESNRVNNLLKEFVNISLLRAGKLHFDLKICHLCEIIEKAIKNIQITYPERKINYLNKLPDGDKVIADEDMLKSVFLSLLDNAIKFSTEKDEVHVVIEALKCYIWIKIVDHGIGISKKDLPTIFSGYRRAANNPIEGIGFGLFISDRIVRRHKGTIKIDTEENKGTKVTVKLPLHKL